MKERIKCETVKDTLYIHIYGEIDHHSAREIRTEIDTKLYEARPGELILDLSSVEFMDSSGLGLILGRYTKASEIGAKFKLLNPTDAVAKILVMSGTDKLIKIERTKSNEQ